MLQSYDKYQDTDFWGMLGQAISKNLFLETSFEKNLRSENQAKVDKTKKRLYLLLHSFSLLLPKVHIWSRHWALDFVAARFWSFPNIFHFPKIQSFKLFVNLWVNYIKVDVKSSFTCAESNLYWNIVN